VSEEQREIKSRDQIDLRHVSDRLTLIQDEIKFLGQIVKAHNADLPEHYFGGDYSHCVFQALYKDIADLVVAAGRLDRKAKKLKETF
jgi:hypothetical protein